MTKMEGGCADEMEGVYGMLFCNEHCDKVI